MRSPRLYLLAVVVVLAAGNLSSTLRRSCIPLFLGGRVERKVVLQEKHPGIDDVHLVTIEGRTVQVDPEVAAVLHVGHYVSKDRLSATLDTPDGDHELGVSKDFRRMAIAMPLILALALLLLRRPRRRHA